jgi:hypothetical protein
MLGTTALVFMGGCNNPVLDNISNRISPNKSGDNSDQNLDITKTSRPKSKIQNLENELRELFISYYRASSVEMRYTQYCRQESGLLNIMKAFYGNTLLTAKLDPSEIPIDTFKITYVNSDLGKIFATTSKTGRNAFNAEITNSQSYYFRKTPSGYKIDWLYNMYEYIQDKDYFCNLGRLYNNNDSESVTIEDLENVPERYKDKSVILKNIKLDGFSNSWVDNLPGVTINSNGLVSTINVKAKEKWIGLQIEEKRKTFWKCFTLKENYDTFKKYVDQDLVRLNLKCQLVQLDRTGGDYGLIVTDYDVFEYFFFKEGEAISADKFR